MRRITLTQQQVALVDDEDFKRVIQFKWHAVWKDHSGYYARRAFRDKVGNIKFEYMHHFILGIKVQVDHKDRNGLNNQWQNLRLANNSQNQANTIKREGTLSKYKGVTRSYNGENWIASIKKENKAIYIGTYSTEDAAAKAYDQKHLNFGENLQ